MAPSEKHTFDAAVRLCEGLLRGPCCGHTKAGALLVERGLAEYTGEVLWLREGARPDAELFVNTNAENLP